MSPCTAASWASLAYIAAGVGSLEGWIQLMTHAVLLKLETTPVPLKMVNGCQGLNCTCSLFCVEVQRKIAAILEDLGALAKHLNQADSDKFLPWGQPSSPPPSGGSWCSAAFEYKFINAST